MITSIENAQVKHLVRLTQKAKYRRECGLYIAEGPRMAREVPAGQLEAIYFSVRFEAEHPQEACGLKARAREEGVRCELLSDPVFSKVSDTVTPQGVLCVVRRRTDTLSSMLAVEGPRLMLLLERIQDPGNLGTILRTGEAAGVTGIIADADTVDLYHPKVVRGTMGAVFRIPFITAADVSSCVRMLRENGIRTAAMALDASSDFYEADFTGDTAFLIGNEGNGLSDALIREADFKIRIPMEGNAQSLNAAVAASLCMYEAKRQRDRMKKHR